MKGETEKMECTSSPSGGHQYNIDDYSRDDQGFYLDCVHCKRTAFFNADTLEEFYSIFGEDDDWEYDEPSDEEE